MPLSSETPDATAATGAKVRGLSNERAYCSTARLPLTSDIPDQSQLEAVLVHFQVMMKLCTVIFFIYRSEQDIFPMT